MGKHYGLALIKGGITKLSELEIDTAPEKTKDILELLIAAQGDIIYRGSEAARLAASYGVGYNFLHAKNTGVDEPEWLDLQDIVAYLAGAVNRMIAPPTLFIPTPGISCAIAEDHSGGGHIVEKVLTIPEPELAVEIAEDHSGGGHTAERVCTIPVPDISVTVELVP